MSTKSRNSNAERFGRWLGRGWRGYVRRERQVTGWLVAQGMPTGGATVLLWIVKLGVLATLLYAAFWLALLLVTVLIVTWVAAQDHSDNEENWPFSTLDELRKTPGYDPVAYNDIEHPDFPDEKES